MWHAPSSDHTGSLPGYSNEGAEPGQSERIEFGHRGMRENTRRNADRYLMDTAAAYTSSNTKHIRPGTSSNHDASMARLSGAFRIESYHSNDNNNMSHGANRFKPNRKNNTKRLSQYIYKAGYKLYGGFIGSHNQMGKQQPHQVP